MSRLTLSLAILLTACVAPRKVGRDLGSTESLIERTRSMSGNLCAPVDFATAQTEAEFARLEFSLGRADRAAEHAEAAAVYAQKAWEATEICGGTDYDGDGIPDVLDGCPQTPEDFDGDRDNDGCRDLDPYADVDSDGVRNIDDDCPDQPEDFDGHNDEDGCPETSEDSDGDGIIDAVDKCPEEAEDHDGFKDADGCPDEDNDLDGIIDIRDVCMNKAEDLDDWIDHDGCPEPDNDSDGVLDLDDDCPNQAGPVDNKGCPSSDRDSDGVSDASDRCPDAPETRNGYLDDDGCPDEANQRVKVTQTQILTMEPVRWMSRNSDEIEASSVGMLGDIVRVMSDVPDMRLRIEGHTDAQGDETANQALSERRAKAVRDYLVSKGVDASRLEAIGYGGTKPIDTNRTERGREANRRIEFQIL